MERRTLVVLLEMDVSGDEAIGKRVAGALREYAADVERGEAGRYAAEQYMTLDKRTKLRVVHGADY
ncbi:MAG TPA: hypothetical protein VD931_22755 [Baekduia sp.]|nr:hypothetical protein [Baekduia sp.]